MPACVKAENFTSDEDVNEEDDEEEGEENLSNQNLFIKTETF